MAGRPGEATESLLQARPLITEPAAEVAQRLGEAYMSTASGRHDLALAITDALLVRADRNVMTAEELTQAAWVAAEAAMSSGDIDRAWALSGVALGHATAAGDARLADDVQVLRTQIAQRRGA